MEDEFYLLYFIKGITPDRIHNMSPWERAIYIGLLNDQIMREADQIKKASGGK